MMERCELNFAPKLSGPPRPIPLEQCPADLESFNTVPQVMMRCYASMPALARLEYTGMDDKNIMDAWPQLLWL